MPPMVTLTLVTIPAWCACAQIAQLLVPCQRIKGSVRIIVGGVLTGIAAISCICGTAISDAQTEIIVRYPDVLRISTTPLWYYLTGWGATCVCAVGAALILARYERRVRGERTRMSQRFPPTA